MYRPFGCPAQLNLIGKQPPRQLVATTTPPSEPAWHRRLRKERSNAKVLYRVARGADLFVNHHGSGMHGRRNAQSSGRSRAENATTWLCKTCKNRDGTSVVNGAHLKQCRICKKLKSAVYLAKISSDPSGSPTTSKNEEGLRSMLGEISGQVSELFKQVAALQHPPQPSQSPAASSKHQQQPKAPDRPEDATEDSNDGPAAEVKRIQKNIRDITATDESVFTLLGLAKADKLQELNRQLEAAQATLRGSKPLTKQQSQIEAHIRKLHKGLEADEARLKDAEDAVQAALAERDVRLAAIAESKSKIEAATKQAADIASRLATELGAPPPTHTQAAFCPGSPEWGALEGLVSLVGNSDVLTALRSQGLPDEHLQTLTGCLSTVRAAGDEQLRRSAAAVPVPTQEVGHRSPGTTDAAAVMVAEGNALQYAALQTKCARMESQLQQARVGVQELEADMSDTESTATALEDEGFRLKSKRRRKRLGEISNVIANLANP